MISRRTRIYVAGPYTIGNQIQNVRRSALLTHKLWQLGYAPYCPLLTHFLDFVTPMDYDSWLAFDKEWLMACDILLWDKTLCPGPSKGAEIEVRCAQELNIPVYYSLEELLLVHPAMENES